MPKYVVCCMCGEDRVQFTKNRSGPEDIDGHRICNHYNDKYDMTCKQAYYENNQPDECRSKHCSA